MSCVTPAKGMGCCFISFCTANPLEENTKMSLCSLGCCIRSYLCCSFFPSPRIETDETTPPSSTIPYHICLLGCCVPSNLMNTTADKLNLCVLEGCSHVCSCGACICFPITTQPALTPQSRASSSDSSSPSLFVIKEEEENTQVNPNNPNEFFDPEKQTLHL